MNTLCKSAIAAALLGAASVPTLAVTIPTSGPAPVPSATVDGGMMLEIWDTNSTVSETVWLGGDLSTFGSPAESSAGRTLDYGVIGGTSGAGAFSSLFSSSDITAGDVLFTVSSAFGNGASPIIDTTLSKTGTVRNSALTGVYNQQTTGIAAVFNAATGCNNVNPCVALNGATDPNYDLGHFNQTLGMGLPTSVSAAGTAGGAAVNFYQLATAPGGSTTLVNTTAFSNGNPGQWTLSSSGDLTYSVAPVAAVPLPAAVWLLGSGLLGLFGIGRRKLLAA